MPLALSEPARWSPPNTMLPFGTPHSASPAFRILLFPTGTLTTRTRMFQKGLPPELGKSPNEKTKPVITNQYSNTLTNTPDQPHPRDQPAPRSARPDSASPINTVTRLEDK